jgi:chromosome segregation ATPase
VNQANAERKALSDRIKDIRKEEYAAGVASSTAEIAALKKQIDDAGDIKAMVSDAHEIVAYTLRFLGKRAEITDARNAALLKQSKTAAAAAVEAKQSLDKVDKKLTEQAVKVDAAASAVQNVEKKLAPLPAPPQPSKGWFGFGGH